jgi:hypothetical protein
MENQTEAPIEAEAQETAPVADTGQAEQSSNDAAWYGTFDDELKGYIQNKGWDDPMKAVKSYQELEKFRGANEDQLLKLPSDPAAEGAYDEIWNKLGRPSDAKEYKVEFEGDIKVDDERLSKYADVAHKVGLTQSQFEALAKVDAEYMGAIQSAQLEQVQQKQEQEYQALRAEWGNNADEREELSRRGLKYVLPSGADADEMVAAIEQAIGTAATLKLFANVGERMAKEDRIPSTADGDRPYGYTREQALADRRALMNELSGSPERLNVYNTGKGTDYEKMSRFNKIIAGEG